MNKVMINYTKSSIRFLAIFLVFVALSSNILSAQKNTFSITLKNATLEQVFSEIEKQSQYRFLYNSNDIDAKQMTSIAVTASPLEATLDQLFKNTNVAYKIEGWQIVLSPAQQQTSSTTESNTRTSNTEVVKSGGGNSSTQTPQTVNVSGKVTDAETGEPMGFVTVYMLKADGKIGGATATDAAGMFKFNFTSTSLSKEKMEFKFLGYDTESYAVPSNGRLDVALKPSSTAVGQVVVTGYQAISKERATGAFNKIGAGIIEQRRASDLSTALVGTVAGLQGKENSDGTFEYLIRGKSSLHADTKPLVVVDGFPVANGFSDINPNDVADVQILKDAAAASIWGARSANGVIVVTTKKGQRSGTSVEVNAMVRIGEKYDLDQVLAKASTKDMIMYEKMAFDKKWYINGYNNTFSSIHSSLSLVLEQLWYHNQGLISEGDMNGEIDRLGKLNNEKQIKDLLLKNPILQQYNVSVSNRGERANNYMSVMYERNVGNVIKNHNDRFRINYNNQTNVFKWLDFSFSTNLHYNLADVSGPTRDEMSALSPYEMILNEDGSYATQLAKNRQQLAKIAEGVLPYEDWSYNLLREVRGRDYTNEAIRARLSAELNFKLFPWLNYTTGFQYEYIKDFTKEYTSDDTYYVRNLVNTYISYDHVKNKRLAQYIPKGGILKKSSADNKNWLWRNQVNFDRIFNNKHAIAVVGGIEIRGEKMEQHTNPWILGYDPDHNTSSYPEANTGSFKNITGSNVTSLVGVLGQNNAFKYELDRFVSLYANASYSFDDRYSVSGSIRYDASNIVADKPSSRWSPFWSVGGKWNISREKFMRSADAWLDRLSVRLTYGFNGNIEKSTSPNVMLSYSSSPSTTYGGLYTGAISSYGNPDLRWEKTGTVNFGIDYAMFGNKLFGSIDVYSKTSKDVIGSKTVAKIYGAGGSNPKINNAEIVNKGIEVEIGVRTPVPSIGLTFTNSLTYAYNKNEIKKLNFPNQMAYYMLNSNSDRFVEGYPLDGVWAYTYAGMIDGVPHVIGRGGEPSSMNDVQLHNRAVGMEFLKYQGTAISPHTLGWMFNVSGYGFNLSLFFDGQFGGVFRNPTWNYGGINPGKTTLSSLVGEVINGNPGLPGWPKEGSTQTYLWDRYVPNLNSMVESSSFIKLREINLEYTLPKRSLDFMGIAKAKVYAQVRNVGCLWTNNSRHYDPEWLIGTMKPVTTYAFGINLNF